MDTTTVAEVVFWCAVFGILYPYLIYPALIALAGTVYPQRVRRHAYTPLVTVLIPAYNEAGCLAATITNKLEQDYPKEKLQIIVISDASTDTTDAVVHGFAARGVQLIRRPQRAGKAAALNEAIRHAKGEIIVFSDANSLFAADAIRRMVENFADPEVGYVTGNLHFDAPGNSTAGGGGNAFMSYENLLRSMETRVGSVIGVNGGVDAIRRDLYREIPDHLITDFILPLHVIGSNRRVIYDRRVHAHEKANTALSSELRMRVRVALRALQGLMYMRRLLNPLHYPGTALRLISHKLLRYLAFAFLPLAFVTNLMLIAEPLYAVLAAGQVLIYTLAIIGLKPGLSQAVHRLTVVPAYFLVTNVAFTIAAIKFLLGQSMATWQPRAG
ncbi:MAG: glycosyltransferase family 2 protein [Gammaproteobacteria bacterium]|nr:glycosyltransferase family 2 protein [Gammaproteobacteria bacterium]